MKKLHYAWAICAACALLLFCIWGICATTFPIFNPYFIKEKHFTNAQVALIPTVRMIFVCIGLSTCHHIHMKIGLRLSGFFSLLGCTAGLLIFAFSSSVYIYYLASAVIGFSYSLGSMMLVSLLLPRWFHSHMAFAMGICTSASGFSTVVLSPVLNFIMERYSLREGLLLMAGIVLVSAFAVLLIIRDFPKNLGLRAFSDPDSDRKKERGRHHAGTHSKHAVLLAVIAYGFFSGLACVGCTQISMLYATNGYSGGQIAAILSIYGGVLTVSKIVYGKLEDLFGNRYVGLGAFVIEVIGSAFMCLCANRVFGYIGAVLYAIGLPLSTMGIPLFAEDLCPPGQYEQTTKTMNMTMFICGLILSPLSGIIADLTGSYVPSYALFTAFTAVSFVLISIAYFTRPKKP